MALRFGLMVPCMKVTGLITRQQAKEDLFMPTEMYMTVNGRMIKPMDMEFTLI